MNARVIFAFLMILGVLLSLFGCGAPVPQAAPPAAQPVVQPTNPPPPPTPEPPYNLDVKVLDAQSAPVSGAVVQAGGKSVPSGANGIASLKDLPGDSINLTIQASGYKSAKLTKTIARGENTLEAVLEEDANGLLQVNACAPGEKLLYIEDFQNGQAPEWDTVENSSDGWSVEGDPANPGNMVMAARSGAHWSWLGGRDKYSFDQVVWRLHFKYTGGGNSHVNFRFVESPDLVRRYLVPVNINEVRLIRFEPEKQVDIGQAGKPAKNEWHLLEISYFNDEVSLYLDGKKGLTWKEPQPWKGGTINLEPNPEGDAVFYYDNFSVCELSAPFTPIPAPKTGYNLAVTLKDAEGKPLPSAGITFVELGAQEQAVQRSDESGKAGWSEVPAGKATLNISAPGYKPVQKTVELQKGDNVVEVTLERDPLGKLASELCRPEETLLYAEDFQSGSIHGMDELARKIELNIPGVSIADDADAPGNKLLFFQGQNDGEHNEAGGSNQMFGDAVLRYNFKMVGDIHQIMRFNWDDSKGGLMAFIYGARGGGGRLEKCITPEGGGECQMAKIGQWNYMTGNGKWHLAELSVFQGDVQIWMDGKKLVKWHDPLSNSQGAWFISHDFWKANTTATYDNFAVCGLKAPFVTLPPVKAKP